MVSNIQDILTNVKTILDGIDTPEYDYPLQNKFIGTPNVKDKNTLESVAASTEFTPQNVLEIWTIDVTNIRGAQIQMRQSFILYDVLVTGLMGFLPQDFDLDTTNNRNAQQVFYTKCESVVQEFTKPNNYQLFTGNRTADVRGQHGGPIAMEQRGSYLFMAFAFALPDIDKDITTV
jgi:hypothetical protein